MLTHLISSEILNTIQKNANLNRLTEIRLRVRKRLLIKDQFSAKLLNYIVSTTDIEETIKRATQNSLYAFQDDIKKGYIPYNGIRIGLSGKGVTDGDKLITIKDFSSLNIRIPHEILGVCAPLKSITDCFENTIIISPPYCGKTTLIRDLARVLSNNYDTLIVDEREEIYNESYNFGDRLDLFINTPKSLIVEGVIRSISPEIIILDEIFEEKDIAVLKEIFRCGIKMVASIHGTYNSVKNECPQVLKYFSNAVELSNKPKVGTIKSIVRLK